MKRIILFDFYKDPIVCRNRLKLLKKLNPEVPIFGLFGGKEEYYKVFQKELGSLLENLYVIKEKSVLWKWKNVDLSIRLWYKDVGKYLSFDMLYSVQWDLLLCSSIESIYKHIPKNGVGFTGLTLLKNIEKKWSWTIRERDKTEWNNLLKYVKEKFSYNQEPYACLWPGVCLPKRFLEKYVSTEIPELCHSELRLPLFSQIFGFTFYDTNFYKKWFDNKEEKFFNCDEQEIDILIIQKELAKNDGRRVFHPYLKIFKDIV